MQRDVRMVGKTPRARKDERQRMDTISVYCGCLPCLLMGHLDMHTTIEHVTERGRRLEDQHMATIGLCVWHHFGHTGNHGKISRYRKELGPALAHGRILFEDWFGDEVQVLIPLQNFLLAQFDLRPWPEHNVNRKAARRTRNEWIRLNANARLPSRARS